MSINHHNYEEYFILYMDNELSGNERRMVEIFAQQHPDLKEELDLLLQYKLMPDTSITYNGKEDLMKVNGDTPVTLTNYEEWLVLYMDNELTAEQKISVDQFLAAHPSLKGEFALLQRTQLQQEEIIFADKASLYRREEKEKPAPVRWWRLAAAAILIAVVGITTVMLVNNNPANKESIVKGVSTERNDGTKNPIVIPEETKSTINENIAGENKSNKQALTPDVKQVVTNSVMARQNSITPKDKQPASITPQQPKEEQVVVVNNDKPGNNLPKPLENPNILKNDASNAAIANVSVPKEISNPKNALTNNTVTTQTSHPSDIMNASYTNTGDADLEQSNGKKNKSRGFFRKVARTFEKRTDIDPTDDNKLLVAGLAIRLK